MVKEMTLVFLLLVGLAFRVYSQGHLSGDLMLNASLYDNDPVIGTNTTQYKHELSSAEGWLFLDYQIKGFEFQVRFDAFHNSPLLDPQEAYTDQGIGFYSISKDIGDLSITGGYFYDQFGSGIIFRAFEDRLLGLDYAIQGLRLRYDFTPKFRIKGFTGKQKNRFTTYPQVIKGIDLQKDFYIGENLQLYSGAAMINRTLDQSTMNKLADEIRGYPFKDRFIPRYNVYAYTFYNTLNFKNFSWYLEYAGKSREAIRNPAGNKLIFRDGYCLYSSLNYSVNRLGISLQYRKNQDFVLRTSPYTQLLEGTMNYMPPVTQQHSLRLPARYSPQALDFGEEGYQAEVTYSPNYKNVFTLNLSYVNNGRDDRLFSAPSIVVERLSNGSKAVVSNAKPLFHELYLDYYRRWGSSLKTTIGAQTLNYDREVYQGKPGTRMVRSAAPFSEVILKLDRRKSIRTEMQYLFTDQDKGDFAFGLLEFNWAPHYSISISDMINTEPRDNGKLLKGKKPVHYYTVYGVYTHHQTRFSLGYVKQVEGVVCTGGVCRVEPAFSGLRFGVTTNF